MPFIILKNEEASESILLNGEMARSEILLTEGSRPQVTVLNVNNSTRSFHHKAAPFSTRRSIGEPA
ncbi:hypothetical protein, partial [Rahnella laticis]